MTRSRLLTTLAMLGTLVAIPASAAEWNTRMPYDGLAAPHERHAARDALVAPNVSSTFNIRSIPSIVLLEDLYGPAVPAQMTAEAPLPPERPRS